MRASAPGAAPVTMRPWLRIAAAALASAIAGLEPAGAEAQDPSTRNLEARWQIAVPGLGKVDQDTAVRLRVQPDGRVSFALGGSLVTLDGAGKVLHKVALPIQPLHSYAIMPLEGGDFLVQANRGGFGEMRLARHAADGRVLSSNTEPLQKEINGILHDAVLLPDGRIAAVASLGPGPNPIMALVVLDRAGRRIVDHRIDLFAIGQPDSARIHALFDGKALEYLTVLGTGNAPRGAGHFFQAFSFMGRVPVASVTRFLGDGPLICSAMLGGSPLVGIIDRKREDQPVVLRWYRRDGEETAQRIVGDAPQCEIALRPDGGSLVWLAPRRLLAFGDDAKPLWRAEFPADAATIGAMPDGDIVALHPAATGVNVVRYRMR